MPPNQDDGSEAESLRRRLLVRSLFSLARVRTRLGIGPTIWIIGAPSSGGKTTFIRSGACQRLTGLSPEAPVVRMGRIRDKLPLLLTRDTIVHYNLLRPVLWAENQPTMPANPLDFRSGDSVWRLLVSLPVEKRAVIVLAEDATVLERVRGRSTRERWNEQPYHRSKFLAAYSKWPPSALYEAWRAELASAQIPYFEVDSESHAVLSRPENEAGRRRGSPHSRT